MTQLPETITCVDCGGTAHLISFLPVDEEPEPETPVAYRCSDCLERFDVIFDSDND
ncbi:MAG: hypothetical protein R3258_03355 [Acidimicrobiia bacterium]|nr:hypothetical protein [Acidimicrobiia bacterium]